MNRSLTRSMALVIALAPFAALMPLTAAHAATPIVTVISAPDGSGIDGRYIVRLRDGTDVAALTRATDIAASRNYSSVFRGFAAAIDPERLETLRGHPDVVAIEQDRRWSAESDITAPALQTPTANWGLDRVDQRALPLNNTFHTPSDGTGVHAYILDTGTDPSHPDFGGRADIAFDAFPGQPTACTNHGTWVGGILGSATFGVAKKVRIHSVRVFDCASASTTEIILAGMEFIRTQGQKPAVVNMSFGGPASPAADAGAKALWDSGFFVGSSAGNTGTDACDHSPSREVYAVTSVNHLDRNAGDNHGKCVDIYAPGVDITSLAGHGTYVTLGGTSGAAPFATGAAAHYKAMFGDASSDTVAEWLNTTATPDVIQQNVPGTPNRLLFIGTGAAPSPPDGTYGYVYANQSHEASYTPAVSYQRNTSGALNRISRSAAGTYRVHMPGLAGTGGIAHAAAATNFGQPTCQVAGEGNVGNEQFIDVKCFGVSGLPQDGTFNASYTRPASGLAGAFGYVRATIRSPGPGGPVFGAGVSYNSTGQDNTVFRHSTGKYTVHFPGLGVAGGTVAISAVGVDPRTCTADNWMPIGPAEAVFITCQDMAGAVADSLFAVTFTNTRSVLGTAETRAHAWVPVLGPGSPPHIPNPQWAFNSTGSPIRVTRLSAGRYSVVFAGVAGSTEGHVTVTATGLNPQRCRVEVMDNMGPDQRATVHCRNAAGQAVDAEFAIQFVW